MTSATQRNAFFGPISSDITSFLAKHLAGRGWSLEGTFRSPSAETRELERIGARLTSLDFSSAEAIAQALADETFGVDWDLLMLSASTMLPIGIFDSCNWGEWEESFLVNSVRQFQLLHGLIPRRHRIGEPIVFLWSGPGTNSAPVRYSAHIVAKSAQIKMCEVLAAEYPDIRFVIVGPGWVATKTHMQTLAAGESAGENFQRTMDRLNSGATTSLDQIAEFLDWIIDQPAEVISGRNFSIRGDMWGSDEFAEFLAGDQHALKLRRAGNDWRPGATEVRYDPPSYA